MGKNINRNGLSRNIPSAVKLEVRRNCNYGCVICGMIPYEYDHLRVSFFECTKHDPSDIVLLCSKHHSEKSKGIISFQDVQNYIKLGAAKDSKSRFKIETLRSDFYVKFGNSELHRTPSSFTVDDQSIFDVSTTDNALEPIILNGKIFAFDGKIIIEIKDNELCNKIENIIDFDLVANKFTYKTAHGINLKFDLNSERINISKIFHTCGDAFLKMDEGSIFAGNLQNSMKFGAIYAEDCEKGIVVNSTIDRFDFGGFDLEKLPYSTMGNIQVRRGFGVAYIGGQRRARVTSNYDWIWS